MALSWIGGCSAPVGSAAEQTASAGEAIYGGALDESTADDGVVAIRIGNDAGSFTLCTGALVAPDVVLTAHHCVASSVAADVKCDAAGASLSGAQLGGDVDATTVHVFTGAHPDVRYGVAAANGRSIVHTVSSVLCNSDIALIVLDRALAIAPLRVRLSAGTQPGETVRAVGYGQSDGAYPVGTRMVREHLAVKAIGAGVSASGTPLASHEMELGQSSCQGDSGGPAISEATGAVIGVVSRSGSCADDFGHVYTETSGFGALIGQVVTSTGSQPLDEPVGPGTPTPDGGSPAPSGSGSGSGGAPLESDAGSAWRQHETSGYTYAPAKACAISSPGRDAGGGGVGGAALAGAIVLAASRRRKRR